MGSGAQLSGLSRYSARIHAYTSGSTLEGFPPEGQMEHAAACGSYDSMDKPQIHVQFLV